MSGVLCRHFTCDHCGQRKDVEVRDPDHDKASPPSGWSPIKLRAGIYPREMSWHVCQECLPYPRDWRRLSFVLDALLAKVAKEGEEREREARRQMNAKATDG